MRREMRVAIVAVGAAIVMAGCGGNDSGTSDTSSLAATGGAATVTTQNVAGVGAALVTSAGKMLYFADQEVDGTIRCVDNCLQFWRPLTVPTGAAPSAGSGITGTLDTINRSDGTVQVTYDGRPLYTFSLDDGPGKAAGNGAKDNFGGTDFVWHAATVTDTGTDSGSSNDGGYGY